MSLAFSSSWLKTKVIEGASAGALLRLPPCRMRIVFLAASAEAPVIVGLFEIGLPDLEAMAPPVERLATGQTSLVLETNEFDQLASRLEAAGVRFLTPPHRYIKSYASTRSPAGTYCQMIVYDPDNALVGIGQIIPLA
jgi:hypothetical protein